MKKKKTFFLPKVQGHITHILSNNLFIKKQKRNLKGRSSGKNVLSALNVQVMGNKTELLPFTNLIWKFNTPGHNVISYEISPCKNLWYQGLLMKFIHTCTHLNVLFVNCFRIFESRKDIFFLENFETKINQVFQSTGPISMAWVGKYVTLSCLDARKKVPQQ